MSIPLRVLLVEDSRVDADLTVRALTKAGYAVDSERVEDEAAMRAALGKGRWDLVLSDHSLPTFDSAGAIATLRELDPDLGCVILSGQLGEATAIEAMRAGADDYVLKDQIGGLAAAVERTRKIGQARRERRLLARELSRQTDYLRAVMESAPIGIVSVDPGGIVISANPWFDTLLGFDGGVIGHHFSELLVPDEIERAMTVFGRLLVGQSDPAEEWRFRRADGREIYVEVTTAVLVEQGEVTGITGIVRDISERRAMELALRQREAYLRTVVESAPVGIVTVDTDGVIRSANPTVERLLGDPKGLIGRSFLELLDPEEIPRATETLGRILHTPERPQRPEQWRARRGDGSEVAVEVTPKALVEGGTTTGILGIIQDLTERRAMEFELRRSEAHLRALVASAPDGILTLTLDGTIGTCNHALVDLLGITDPLVGRRFQEFIHPEDLATHWTTPQGPVTEEGRPLELRLLRSDGAAVDVEITTAPLRESGWDTGTLCVVRDVTRRKEVGRELVLREERFRLVTLATTDAVYDWDLIPDRVWWSEGALTVFGAAPPANDGSSWWSAKIHPQDRERVLRGLELAAAERRDKWTDEYRFLHSDGTWHDVVDRGLYLYDGAGRAVRMIGAMADISDRRAFELEELRLRRALEDAATDWTVTFDAVPLMLLLVGGDGVIRRLNQAARAGLGGEWSELIGHSIDSLAMAPWPAATAIVQRALQATGPVIEQVEDPATDRTWSVLAATLPTPEDPHAVLLIRETSDVVRIQRTSANERTMAALGALVAGVAHEVRNPLFAISATLDAFEARYGGQPEFAKYAKNLRPEVSRLSVLMHDLLEYGRPASLQASAGDLRGVLNEGVELVAAAAALRQVRIVIEGAESPMLLTFDPARMLQVVQNLLDNALVHAPSESVLRIRLTSTVEGGQAWGRIAIEDEGEGFRTDDLPHVFEPFFSRRRGGTGLGLSIVDRLVRQHGGRVIAENRAEGGARVIVQLPKGDP